VEECLPSIHRPWFQSPELEEKTKIPNEIIIEKLILGYSFSQEHFYFSILHNFKEMPTVLLCCRHSTPMGLALISFTVSTKVVGAHLSSLTLDRETE
jgi:hypothetical protein